MHKRLMHVFKKIILKTCKNADIKFIKDDDFYCETCFLNKIIDIINRESSSTLIDFDQLIRTDLIFHKIGHLGYCYFVHFIDIWLSYHWMRFVKEKHEAFQIVKNFTKFFENQSKLKMQTLNLNENNEFGLSIQLFKHSKLREWANKRNLIIKKMIPYTLLQNDQVEQTDRIILKKVKSSMIQVNFFFNLWSFAVDIAVKIINLLLTKRNQRNVNPQQIFFEIINLHESLKNFYIRHFRTFDCRVYVYIKTKTRKKLQKMSFKTKKKILIDYDDLHEKIFWI